MNHVADKRWLIDRLSVQPRLTLQPQIPHGGICDLLWLLTVVKAGASLEIIRIYRPQATLSRVHGSHPA